MMTQPHTVIKLVPAEVGMIQACIELCREIIPDDKDMKALEERFSGLPYVWE